MILLTQKKIYDCDWDKWRFYWKILLHRNTFQINEEETNIYKMRSVLDTVL